MRRSPCIFALLACLAVRAEGVDLSLKPKAIASEMAVRSLAQAPFVGPRDALPLSVAPGMPPSRGLRAACERSSHDMCYDTADGRIVYRPARALMPRIGELTPESVSLRRDRIIFKYSF